MSDSAGPGWYHAEGDQPGTERYWDGSAWTEGPRPIGGAPEVVADLPETVMPETVMPEATVSGDFGASTAGPVAGGFGGPAQGATQGGFPAAGAAPATGFPGAPMGGQYVHGYPEESNATTALIVSIVGFLLCFPSAIIGGFMGNSERKAIEEGRRDPANVGQATAALVIGVVAFVLTLLAVLAIVVVFAIGATA